MVKLVLNLAVLLAMVGCSSTEIVDSPKTVYVSDAEASKDPQIIWTSQALTKPYDYLGQVKVRSMSYDGGLERLKEAGKTMKADALTDLHFERVGFLKVFHAFAIKFKNQ